MNWRYIVIPKWDEFQHKDVWRKSGGRPPWVKCYTRLLHKDEYVGLTLAQRGLLHGLWMLYASSGQVLNEYTARQLLCTNQGESSHFARNLQALSDAGLIHIQSHLEERREEETRKTLVGDFPQVTGPRQALELLKGGNEEAV